MRERRKDIEELTEQMQEAPSAITKLIRVGRPLYDSKKLFRKAGVLEFFRDPLREAETVKFQEKYFVEFFSENQNNNPLISNMPFAGMLPYPQKFEVHGITVKFFLLTSVPPKFGVKEIWQEDSERLIESSYLKFTVGARDFISALPLAELSETLAGKAPLLIRCQDPFYAQVHLRGRVELGVFHFANTEVWLRVTLHGVHFIEET